MTVGTGRNLDPSEAKMTPRDNDDGVPSDGCRMRDRRRCAVLWVEDMGYKVPPHFTGDVGVIGTRYGTTVIFGCRPPVVDGKHRHSRLRRRQLTLITNPQPGIKIPDPALRTHRVSCPACAWTTLPIAHSRQEPNRPYAALATNGRRDWKMFQTQVWLTGSSAPAR